MCFLYIVRFRNEAALYLHTTFSLITTAKTYLLQPKNSLGFSKSIGFAEQNGRNCIAKWANLKSNFAHFAFQIRPDWFSMAYLSA